MQANQQMVQNIIKKNPIELFAGRSPLEQQNIIGTLAYLEIKRQGIEPTQEDFGESVYSLEIDLNVAYYELSRKRA